MKVCGADHATSDNIREPSLFKCNTLTYARQDKVYGNTIHANGQGRSYHTHYGLPNGISMFGLLH